MLSLNLLIQTVLKVLEDCLIYIYDAYFPQLCFLTKPYSMTLLLEQ